MAFFNAFSGTKKNAFIASQSTALTNFNARAGAVEFDTIELQGTSQMFVDREPTTGLIDDDPDDFTVTLA